MWELGSSSPNCSRWPCCRGVMSPFLRFCCMGRGAGLGGTYGWVGASNAALEDGCVGESATYGCVGASLSGWGCVGASPGHGCVEGLPACAWEGACPGSFTGRGSSWGRDASARAERFCRRRARSSEAAWAGASPAMTRTLTPFFLHTEHVPERPLPWWGTTAHEQPLSNAPHLCGPNHGVEPWCTCSGMRLCLGSHGGVPLAASRVPSG